MGYSAKEILESNMRKAIESLAPKFGISHKRRDICYDVSFSVTDSETASYDYKNRIFIFNETRINNKKSLGEEASHYLHGEVNMLVFQDLGYGYKTEFSNKSLIETVGCYGSLVYLASEGMKIVRPPHKKIAPNGFTQEDCIFYFSHYYGYKRAYKLFQQYGESMLSRVARLSLEDSISVLPQLAPINLYERHILPFVKKHLKAVKEK